MKRYSKKGLERRKAERECLSEFFERHIEIAKNKKCEECGERLIGDSSEIAHVLPKKVFKSVMCEDDGVLYLCGKFSSNQCHTNLDNLPDEKIKEMRVYPKIQEIFQQLKDRITEKITYKTYDRYE